MPQKPFEAFSCPRGPNNKRFLQAEKLVDLGGKPENQRMGLGRSGGSQNFGSGSGLGSRLVQRGQGVQ